METELINVIMTVGDKIAGAIVLLAILHVVAALLK